MCLCSFVTAETIILPGNEDIANILNETNNSITENGSISQTQFSDLLIAINTLQEQTVILTQEKEILSALNDRLEKDRIQYLDTLDESKITINQQKEVIEQLQNSRDEFVGDSDIKIETLTSEITATRLELQKYKIKVFLWVLCGILVTIIIFETIHSLAKRGKLYFVIRWIRNKIPIRF